jgi:pimeloyl-ACP methyl ester carboxylesterase
MANRLWTVIHATCEAIRGLPATDTPLRQLNDLGIDRGKYDATLPIREKLAEVLGFLERFERIDSDRFPNLPESLVVSLEREIGQLRHIADDIPNKCKRQTSSVVPPSFHGAEVTVARSVDTIYGRIYPQLDHLAPPPSSTVEAPTPPLPMEEVLQNEVRSGEIAASTTTPANERVVFPLYGIRTRGEWQDAFADVAARDGWKCRRKRWNFGRFSLPQFLWPFGRARKIRWFEATYHDEVNDKRLDLESDERPSVVAHSFGTYIVGWALYYYKHLKVNKVILCGAILPKDFPWDKLLKRGQVRAVRNEYGVKDIWVKLVRFFVPKTGRSGADGFTCCHPKLEQERFEFSHSQYFAEGHMEAFWMPFLNRIEVPLKEESVDLVPPKSSLPVGLYLVILFLFCIAAISMAIMFHKQPAVSLSECGFFSDDYGPNNTWRPYDLSLDQGKRLWIACQAKAHEDVEVSSIQTAAGKTNAIFVGYQDQRLTRSVRLKKNASQWLAVVVDPESADRHLLPFAHSSKFVLLPTNGRPPVTIWLPPLVSPGSSAR